MKSLTRKIVPLGVAAAVAISLAGCSVTTGNPTGEKSGAPEQKDEYRVAYIARAQADSFAAWLANESLQRVDNWNDLTPPEGETENEDDSTEETVETTLPERKEENTPPIAEDDTFGVRPGVTTMLPVLDNDNDPDGDVLVATLA